MNGWAWQRVTRHGMALFGIVTPPLNAVLNTIVAAQQPSYDFVHNWVSDLTAYDRPFSGILRAWWATFPLQFWPFAVALALGLRNRPFGMLVPALLALFALCIALCGVFPFDPTSPGATPSSRIHIAVSTVSSALLFPCPILLWWITRRDDTWQRVGAFSMVIQLAGIAAGITLALTWIKVVTLHGLVERMFWGVYYVWIVGVALKLREMEPPT